MYTEKNYQTKKGLRSDVAAGVKVKIFSPRPFPAPTEGWTTVEGPQYPQPHRWYARVFLEHGIIVKIL